MITLLNGTEKVDTGVREVDGPACDDEDGSPGAETWDGGAVELRETSFDDCSVTLVGVFAKKEEPCHAFDIPCNLLWFGLFLVTARTAEHV